MRNLQSCLLPACLGLAGDAQEGEPRLTASLGVNKTKRTKTRYRASHKLKQLPRVDRQQHNNINMTNGFRDMKTNDMSVTACRGCCNYPNGKASFFFDAFAACILAASFSLHLYCSFFAKNGKIGIAAVCLGVLGFVLTIPAAFGCSYFKDGTAYFGLFTYEFDGVCFYWSDESEFHGSWSFARAMAAIATLCGAIALIFTLCLSCMSMPNPLLITTSVLYLLAALCLILTLVAFAGCDYYGFECKVAGGAILAIIAPMIYFGAALLVFKVPLYTSSNAADNAAQASDKGAETATYAPGNEVTITVTELPDGSKKTVKTIVDENGNETIEETIEPPESDTEDEEEVVVSYLPDGSIKTTRTTIEKDGTKTVRETIEQPKV